ncbi:hypothetical protein V8V73_26270, partial [Priestia megaterium]|uniref:hypothetical protein n=1 Tax=Priestia megaterium TaxID=1404 RepID=UPI0030080FF2
MGKEFTLKELVKKYGSKAMMKSFKEKGNLSGKEFKTVMKVVLTEWESYEVEGRGSKRIVTCIGKRSKKVQKVDKRSNNGQGQLVGQYELSSLVVTYLIRNNNKVRAISATKWLTELDIVDEKLTGALYGSRTGHMEKLQKQFSSNIKDYNEAESDIDMLDEFLQTALRHLKSSLVSVFNKLHKAKIITHKKEQWGCTITGRHRKLKRKEAKSIVEMRQTLLNFYGIEAKDLFMKNKKVVKEFKHEFEKQLQKQLGIKYYYDAHHCIIPKGDSGILDYLYIQKENCGLDFIYRLTEKDILVFTEVYKGMHSKHSLELAMCRERNCNNSSDSDRVKYLKIMNQYTPMWEVLL